MKPPKNQKGVREILGMVGYYRKFINRFADAARSMTNLTRKGVKFEWTDECQIEFDYLKKCLIEALILKYPNPSKKYVVLMDASDQAAAAVLIQEYPSEDRETKEMAIAYLSVQFSYTQFKWSTVVKEGYTIYYVVKKWRQYLEDAEILLKNNAKSLQKFLAGRTNYVKLDRWSLELQGRNIQVEHIPGHKNKAANWLSWLSFATRKRNNNPLKDEDVPVYETRLRKVRTVAYWMRLNWLTQKLCNSLINIASELPNWWKILGVGCMKGIHMGMMTQVCCTT